MEQEKRKALEAAGFRVGDAEDFLALTEGERRLVELRVQVSHAVRRLRQLCHLTQQELATKIESSQSRVAKLEAGSPDVSLDLLFRGLFAVGGSLSDVAPESNREPEQRRGRSASPKKPSGGNRPPRPRQFTRNPTLSRRGKAAPTPA